MDHSLTAEPVSHPSSGNVVRLRASGSALGNAQSVDSETSDEPPSPGPLPPLPQDWPAPTLTPLTSPGSRPGSLEGRAPGRNPIVARPLPTYPGAARRLRAIEPPESLPQPLGLLAGSAIALLTLVVPLATVVNDREGLPLRQDTSSRSQPWPGQPAGGNARR